jgi:hypothetical protein
MTDRAKGRPCGGCGEGYLQPTNIRGRKLDHRDDPAVLVLEDLVVPVCDTCGDMPLTLAQATELDAVLERAYRRKRLRQQRALLHDLRDRGLTQGQIEQFAGLSQGYVSKLAAGKKLAGGKTFKLLYLLHRNPEAALSAIGRIDPRMAKARERLKGVGA